MRAIRATPGKSKSVPPHQSSWVLWNRGITHPAAWPLLLAQPNMRVRGGLFQQGVFRMHGTIGQHESGVRRIRRARNDWTLKEHEVVISFWPNIDEIAKRLPHRTLNAIRSFAGKCNLRKHIHSWTTIQDRTLRCRVKEMVPQKEISKELGLTETQLKNRMRQIGLTYARRPPKVCGHPLLDSIRRRAFDLNMSMAELDEACHSGRKFEKGGTNRKIHIKHMVKAVTVLDGDLTVQWRE
jgi:hypothetical protein